MIPLLLAAAALGGFAPFPVAQRQPHPGGKVGTIPAPSPDAVPAYDGKHCTTPAPKGKRLTRAQRKALKAKATR